MDLKSNYESQALTSLPLPFWSKPYLGVIAQQLAKRWQGVEDAAYAVALSFLVDTAVGEQLEWIGQFVNQPNYGFGDEDYRRLVKSRIRINLSHGRRDDLHEVIAYFYSGTAVIEKSGVARIQITTDEMGDAHQETFRIAMRDAKGHGIALDWVYSLTAGLRWSHTDSTLGVGGWGSSTDPTGATFSGDLFAIEKDL